MLIVSCCRHYSRAHESALCYHGLLRVGTGLSLLEGMEELDRRAEEIDVRESANRVSSRRLRVLTVPAIRLIHGNKDRATSHLGTLKLFDRLPNKDKQIQIYDGYEHGEWWLFPFLARLC